MARPASCDDAGILKHQNARYGLELAVVMRSQAAYDLRRYDAVPIRLATPHGRKPLDNRALEAYASAMGNRDWRCPCV